MPTYEYECTKCERIFEEYHSITAKALKTIKTDCAQCNNKAPVRRLIGTGAAVLFKGGGFYETDYRSEDYKSAAKKETESASESKPVKEGSDSAKALSDASGSSGPSSSSGSSGSSESSGLSDGKKGESSGEKKGRKSKKG